uniref:Putative secreted protein n=1 Tax=Panstrongylus lignarius TaxID=156445 RepID=A0A224XN14_9HEMI
MISSLSTSAVLFSLLFSNNSSSPFPSTKMCSSLRSELSSSNVFSSGSGGSSLYSSTLISIFAPISTTSELSIAGGVCPTSSFSSSSIISSAEEFTFSSLDFSVSLDASKSSSWSTSATPIAKRSCSISCFISLNSEDPDGLIVSVLVHISGV